ncbi:MAG: diacylglycerol kinase family protein [Salinivirgaceae bacterium]
MNKKRVLFIINPISGTGKQEGFPEVLNAAIDRQLYDFDMVFSEYRGHATLLSQNAVADYQMVVAVGGDGTVNEVAKGLINSPCIMGIVPVGSGNGLARHLNIPMRVKEAIELINEPHIQKIDMASLNGEYFVNVAGIGFDAHIAHLFAAASKRGPIPYAKLATVEFQKYKPAEYKVFIEGQEHHLKAFLISFANSAQFGNNAYISPHAIINDGLLDVCLMSEFPKVEAGQLAIKLFNKRLDKSKYMKIIRGTRVKIVADENLKGHLDGEPINLPRELDIQIIPNSLHVIYNPKKPFFEVIGKKIKDRLPNI